MNNGLRDQFFSRISSWYNLTIYETWFWVKIFPNNEENERIFSFKNYFYNYAPLQIVPLNNMFFRKCELTGRCRILLKNAFHYVKRLYVIFWHELSLDERVRASPYVPPPENEVKMSLSAIVFFRYMRTAILMQHVASVIALYLCVQRTIKIQTLILAALLLILGGLGIVCGAHRLWAHNSYKARWPLRVFLMLCQTLSTQFSIYSWVRDHRLHHKVSDTPADPHDSNRGFFFSHIGWFLIQRTPEMKEGLRNVWMEDLKRDKIVMFQYRIYIPLVFLISFIGPCFIPWYLWNENLLISHLTVTHLRNVLLMHMTFTVNSIAHMWGMKPFDRSMRPVDSVVVWLSTLGCEGWHNYHHVFPWDYKPSEFWGYKGGLGTMFIELCARMGLAYNLKTTSVQVAMRRRQRTGDLSCNVWGWNDASIDIAEKKRLTVIRYEEKDAKMEPISEN